MNVTVDMLFDRAEDEYLEFERIPKDKRLHENRSICGLLYLYNLLNEKGKHNWDYHAEHDILYLADIEDLKDLTEEDVIYLSRCGFHLDGESDCISDFC